MRALIWFAWFAGVAAAQTPSITLVANAEGEQVMIGPNTWVEVKGQSLARANDTRIWAGSDFVNGQMPTSLDGTSVTVNGKAAFVYYISATQVNILTPPDAMSGTVNVVVTTSAGTSAAQTVNVLPAVPGIFTANASGLGQAIATDNTTNLIAAAAGSIAGITTSPISLSSGHALIVWCTGLGAVTPFIADNANSFNPDGTYTLRNTVLKPTVTIGDVEAQFVYSILSPQYVSEYQIGVVPGAGTPTGSAVPLQISINGITTSNQVTIAVAP